jgi:hypothetical protein
VIEATATKPNQHLGGDITYIEEEEEEEGWLYIAIVIVLFARKAIAHSTKESILFELVIEL